MSKIKKCLTELKEEEQLIGWVIYISLGRDGVEGHVYVNVDTKERAEKVAHKIAEAGYFKPEKDEELVIIGAVSDIVTITTSPRTRTIYVK